MILKITCGVRDLKKNLKRISIVSLFILAVILVVLFNNHRNHIDAQLFKSGNLSSTDIDTSWQSFKKELTIQDDRAKIDRFRLTLEGDRIYSVEFDLIDKRNGEFDTYRYSECFLCEEEEGRYRDVLKTTHHTMSEYSELMDADQFFTTLDRLKQNDILKTISDTYKMIAADGYREKDVGVEGDYYILKDDGIHRVKKLSNDTYSGYLLRVMGNNNNREFGTSKDSITIFFDGQSE